MCLFLVIMKGSHSAVRRGRKSSGAAGLLCPLLGACLWAAVVGYKPVIIVHGLFDSSGDFKNLQRFINEVSDQSKDKLVQCGCFCWYSVERTTYTFYFPGVEMYSIYCRPYSLYNHMLSVHRVLHHAICTVPH